MKKRSAKVTDPLFETIDLAEDHDLESLYTSLLNTFELRRAQWVHQSGLLFQIYHGCTHTRRAHAIGCWCVGWYALNDIKVITPKERDKEISLKKWLTTLSPRRNKKLLVKAFLAALLLHDIGHPPFSHALELTSLEDLKLDHEEITRSLITGEPDSHNRNWRMILIDYLVSSEIKQYPNLKASEAINRWRDRAKNLLIVNNALIKARINPQIVKNILSEPQPNEIKDIIPRNTKQKDKRALQIFTVLHSLRQLVDSQIDLDRIDHFLRDSYFSGLRFADYRIRPFLLNLRVVPRDTQEHSEISRQLNDVDPPPSYIVVKKEGLEHFQQLLVAREFIFNKALWVESNLFLTGALIQALRVAIKIFPAIKVYLPFLTDVTLMQFLKTELFRGSVIEGYRRIVSGEISLSEYRCFRPKSEIELETIGQQISAIYEKADKENAKEYLTPQIVIFSNFSKGKRQVRSSKWGAFVVDTNTHEGYKKLDQMKSYEKLRTWRESANAARKNNIRFWFRKGINPTQLAQSLGISRMLAEV